MKLDAVLFDIDGTLVDSNEVDVDAWAFAFRDAGKPQERDAIRGQIGKGGDLLVPTLLPHESDKTQARIAEAQGRLFAAGYLEHVKPFPGARGLIERTAAAGLKVVLASSAKAEELDHYMGLLGIGDLVAATTSIDDVETSKPAPDIFATALAKIDVDPRAPIVIGDTPYDVEAATRNGIVAIGLLSGPFDKAALRDAGAIAVYRDVADLLANYERSPLVSSF